MASFEVARRLIDGIWRTVIVDEGAGGGGGGTPTLSEVLAEGADADGAVITDLADPSADQDAATKKYVDDNAGGSQPFEYVIQTVNFDDFELAEGVLPSWPGRAPYMTINPGTWVVDVYVFVTVTFDDSGPPSEIQVTNDPDGEAAQCSPAPDPREIGSEVVGDILRTPDSYYVQDAGTYIPYTVSAPVTPVVALNQFAGDGTQGQAIIITKLYTP